MRTPKNSHGMRASAIVFAFSLITIAPTSATMLQEPAAESRTDSPVPVSAPPSVPQVTPPSVPELAPPPVAEQTNTDQPKNIETPSKNGKSENGKIENGKSENGKADNGKSENGTIEKNKSRVTGMLLSIFAVITGHQGTTR